MSVKDNFPALKPSLLLDFANTKVLDPRITFSRASTAVFYDDKTVAKAEENLALESQTFNTSSWTKQNSTITADATTAPDGTLTADKLIADTTSARHFLQAADPFRQYNAGSPSITYSVYAKAGEYNQLYFLNDSGYDGVDQCYAFFNLTTGSVGTVVQGYTAITNATITSVGNGWYRCSVYLQYAIGSSRPIGFGVSNADGTRTFAGDNASGIFIWGAQIEIRNTLTAYTPTTTQPITNYIPVLQTAAANVARFDHNPVTRESLGLLVEEQRTNLLTYSEQFDNAVWNKNNCSIQPNVIIAPDGTLTGDALIENVDNAFHVVNQGSAVSVGSVYTFSIYVKSNKRTFVQILPSGGQVSGNPYVNFDLNAVTATTSGSITATITHVGNNWYRCSVTVTAALTTLSLLVCPTVSATATRAQAYTGDGYSGIYIWGAQLEAGSFATSYIPTVASQVTRSADSASMTGTNFSSWFNQAEGTTYVESSCAGVNAGAYPGVLIFSSGSTSNRFGIYGTPNGAGYGAIMMVAGGIAASLDPISGSTATIINTFSKLAYAYKTNDFAATRNALSVTTDAVGAVAVVNSLYIGQYDTYLNGTIKKLAYYPVRCTNLQLQALTQQG